MTINLAADSPDPQRSAEPSSAAPRILAVYWRLWRGVVRELGFLIINLPIALAGFVITITLFVSGVGTLVTFVGLFVIVAALYSSRAFGTLELVRLEWAGRPATTRPEWQDARARQGFWGWLRSLFGNGHYWLYLLHTSVINFVVSLVTWIVTVVWVSIAAAGLSYWFWQFSLPQDDSDWHLSDWLASRWGIEASGLPVVAIDMFVYFVLGVIFTALLPFVTRGLVLLHDVIARATLGAFKSDALQREVIALSASRGAAVSAEGHSLRRLERDIHDGPQQRLVRLQMDLSSADRQVDADPAKAHALIAEAMVQAKDALEELRALSRGFAPPILLDRGLVAALESAAIRSTVPTRIITELPDGIDLPQEIERNAYFAASEAIMNAAKHSGATDVEVRVGLRRVPQTDDTWLALRIADNGRGGAAPIAGHGLAGLEERMQGLGGAFLLKSPVGGPTEVTVQLPITTTLRGSV